MRPGHFKTPVDSTCLFPPLLPVPLELEEDTTISLENTWAAQAKPL